VTAIRRIYMYVLAFAGLLMLAAGAANLGRVLVEILTQMQPGAPDYVRDQVSQWGAAALLGLPVWLIHWWWAQRLAAANEQERSSTLRRLYVYAVLAIAVLGGAVAAHEALENAVSGRWAQAATYLPILAVASVVWIFTWRIAADDRNAVGETGGSATLRRWYVYGAAVIGLGLLLDGTRQLVEALWLVLLAGGSPRELTRGVPAALVGLALAVMHALVIGRQFAREDETSTLRSVALFGSLAAAVGGTLLGVSQMLYYALARAFGVERPGGVGGSLLEAAAGPVSVVVVFGIAWLGLRLAVREQAQADVRVRRVYTYLVALVSVAVLAVGVGGLLWVLADALTSAPGTSTSDWWRDRVAQFATLTLVSLPVWVAYWRPGVPVAADEAGSLSRRIYAYLVLIVSGLVLLYSAVDAAYRVLTLLLGATPSASLMSNLAHDLALAIVAGLLVAHHALTVRADARASAVASKEDAEAIEVVWRVRAPDASRLQRFERELKKNGVEVEVISEARSPEHT
jgi:Domain of unknown function (DUF5671)